MRLVSFDALRTLRIPNVTYIKPERFYRELSAIETADWVLFPEHWQINALVYGLHRKIFPSQASYLLGHDKIEMTRAFAALFPEHLPETLIEPNDPVAAERVFEHLSPPFVAKIPRSSMGEGVFLIDSRDAWRDYLRRTPVIYAQEYLPIDRDLRILYVGERIIGGFWRLQAPQGFHNNIARGGVIDRAPIPRAARDLVVKMARAYGIDHAGFDVAMVNGHPYVLEFNRLFGNRGLQGREDRLAGAILSYLRQKSGNDGPGRPLRPRTRLRVAV